MLIFTDSVNGSR